MTLRFLPKKGSEPQHFGSLPFIESLLEKVTSLHYCAFLFPCATHSGQWPYTSRRCVLT